MNDNANGLKAFGGGGKGCRRPASTEGAERDAFRRPGTDGWGLRALALTLWAALRREMECARSIRELEQLDERSLRDIGIAHRSEIEYLVRHGRERR